MKTFATQRIRALAALQLVGVVSLLTAPQVFGAADDRGQPRRTTVFGCFPGPDGVLTGGPIEVDVSEPADAAFVDFPFTTLLMNGPSGNRIDIVFVGDGFQTGQLASYATVVNERWATMKASDPYVSYLPYFNAHRVDVPSQDSGVDNDPMPGILKNTALDSGFWCQGVERLLCASVTKTHNAAASAPDWDQVLLVANSSKYGGAGYASADICTFSAFDASSLQIALHELGHAFGDLADEYDYGDGASYSGPEVPELNVSIQTEAQMQSSGSKWKPWLGISLPMVGVHGAFQGARYFQFGIRRPTGDSLMRSLGLPFNGPSLEAMIVEIHKATIMVDSATKPVGSTFPQGDVLTVTTVEPASHALAKQWYLAGAPISGATETSIATAGLTIPKGGATLSVVITDPTIKVQNEALRDAWLRETYQWFVTRSCLGDLNASGHVDAADMAVLLGGWGTTTGDLNQSGTTDAADLGILLAAWGDC